MQTNLMTMLTADNLEYTKLPQVQMWFNTEIVQQLFLCSLFVIIFLVGYTKLRFDSQNTREMHSSKISYHPSVVIGIVVASVLFVGSFICLAAASWATASPAKTVKENIENTYGVTVVTSSYDWLDVYNTSEYNFRTAIDVLVPGDAQPIECALTVLTVDDESKYSLMCQKNKNDPNTVPLSSLVS